MGGMKFGEVILYYILLLVCKLFYTLAKKGFTKVGQVVDTLGCTCFLKFLSLNIAFMVTAKRVSFSVKPIVFYYTLVSNCALAARKVSVPITFLVDVLMKFTFKLFGKCLMTC